MAINHYIYTHPRVITFFPFQFIIEGMLLFKKLTTIKEKFMKKSLIGFICLSSFSLFANEITLNCNTLLNGNYNEKAYVNAKSINATLTLDLAESDAKLVGDLIVKEGQYTHENDQRSLSSYFTDGKKVEKNGDFFTISSHDSNIFLCGIAGDPCHNWEKLTLNLKTGEGLFEKSYAYKMVFYKVIEEVSVKFKCTR